MARKTHREAPEMAAMLGRMMRAMARRAAEGDPEALEALVGLQATLQAATVDAANGLHDFGYSWTEVADAVGITRQAARQRFARPAVLADEAVSA